MAKYELPIYGENDEIIKMHETNVCPWAVYVEAADLQEKLQDKGAKEQMQAVGNVLKSVFCNLTEEELMRADGMDVMNTFQQIVTGGQKINGGSTKNVQRARK